MSKEQRHVLIRIIAAAVLSAAIALSPVRGTLAFAAYLIPYLIVAYDVLAKAAKNIAHGEVFDENFLMAVASLGALAIGLFKTGDFIEAVAVILFYRVGELFEDLAVDKSRRNISALMDIRPDYAYMEVRGEGEGKGEGEGAGGEGEGAEGGGLRRVHPADVPVGSIIVVRPGERVPLDGTVLSGTSTLDTAALTGESLPRDIAPGDDIVSGCVNLTGVLRVRTTCAFGESTVSKILGLVENAAARKSRSEQFITRFARIYTPAVCLAALLLAFVPPVVRVAALGLAPEWGIWVYRALAFLVISCPCALVIGIPLSFFAGIGGASRAGILVKGSNYLEALAKCGVVVFDKTGTLTRGAFEVVEVRAAVGAAAAAGVAGGAGGAAVAPAEVLRLAAAAESASPHPIAASLRAAASVADGEADVATVTDIVEVPGKGVRAVVDGAEVAVGNARFMQELGISTLTCANGEGEAGEEGETSSAHAATTAPAATTAVYVAAAGTFLGEILIADAPKPTAAEAVARLKAAGISPVAMLTGDAHRVASAVARTLDLDRVCDELLPQDKVVALEALMAEFSGKRAAFVGDGINDAPALARADVGIAMGALGSDAAIEAADVVLMDDDPRNVAHAICLARRTMRIVRENIVFSLGAKALVMVLVALGAAGMWLAVFADVGVMLLAVLNAMRCLRVGSSLRRPFAVYTR